MKNFEIHAIKRCYQEEHLEFFSEFFVHILRQQRRSKWKKGDFNTYEVGEKREKMEKEKKIQEKRKKKERETSREK